MKMTKTQKIINLTPHAVIFPNRSPSITIESSGQVARCKELTSSRGKFAGIPLVITNYGNVENLPEPEEDTLYIVSMLVRMALSNRKDLASPGELIRDDNGQIVGAQNLIVNSV